jgi:hypothetical protein
MNTLENLKALFFSIFGTIILLVSLCYTAGYAYAYHYFKHFSLGLIDLDILNGYFLMYGLQTIKHQLLPIIIIFFIVVLFIFLIQALSIKYVKKNLTLALLLPLISCIFFVFYIVGEKTGNEVYAYQQENDFPSYFRAEVWTQAPKNAKYGKEMENAWQSGCYRLLMQNEDYLFVFRSMTNKGKIPTDMIPKDKVSLVRVLPVNKSCSN